MKMELCGKWPAISGDINVIKKEYEKILKYKDLTI